MKQKFIIITLLTLLLNSCQCALFVPSDRYIREKEGYLMGGFYDTNNVYFIETNFHSDFGQIKVKDAFIIHGFLCKDQLSNAYSATNTLELITAGIERRPYDVVIVPVRISYISKEKGIYGQETLMSNNSKLFFDYSIYNDLKVVDLEVINGVACPGVDDHKYH